MSTEFAKLTPGSRILLVHSRAIIKNAAEYRPMAKTERTYGCPQWSLHPDHQYGGNVSCAGLWWEDLDGYQVRGDGLPVDPPEWLMRGTGVPSERLVSRPMPSFEYGGFRAPDGVAAEYIPGFFASFPLTRVAIVKDPDEGKHEQTLEAAKDTTLPLELVDE